MTAKTWFITGASAGFGRILTEKLLAQGHSVVATARKPEVLSDLKSQYGDNIITPTLDVNNQSDIDQAIRAAITAFTKIDVLVNNAGYGQVGTIEEVTDTEVREQFDTNVFGLLNVTRPILAHMRQSGGGYIQNLSSIAGLTSSATFPIYCASKHAVEAISEGLAASVAPFNIKVTIIEPGAFRTRFADSQSLRVTPNRIPAYDEQMNGTMDWINDINKAQPGDPEKVVDAMINLATQENPPLRLLCGQDAYDRAMAKLDQYRADFERNAKLTCSMAYTE